MTSIVNFFSRFLFSDNKYKPIYAESKFSLIKKRGKIAEFTSIFVFVVSFAILVIVDGESLMLKANERNNTEIKELSVSNNATYSLLLFLFPFEVLILHRIFLFCEELYQVPARYADYKCAAICTFCDKFFFVYCLFGMSALMILACRFPGILLQYFTCACFFASGLLFKGYSPVEMSNLLDNTPAIGQAMAMGSYFAYFRNILNGFQERLENFEKEKNIIFRLKKLIIILTTSCEVPTTFEKYKEDKNIKFYDEISITTDHGGNVNRNFKCCIYEIADGLKDPIYFVAEVPQMLSILCNMKLYSSKKYSEHKFKQQLILLRQQLESLLSKDKKCLDSYILRVYDDEKARIIPSEFIKQIIMEEIRKKEEIISIS